MAASDQTLQEYNDLQNQYKQFGVTDPNAIYNQLAAKVGGFAPQYQELAKANTAAYASPATTMSNFSQQYGSDPGQGPDPYARLVSLLNTQGNKVGIANTLSGTLGTLGGNLKDLSNSVYGNVQAVGTNLQNRANSALQIYQAQKQNEAAMAATNAQLQALQFEKQKYYDQLNAAGSPGVLGANTAAGGAGGAGGPITINTTPNNPIQKTVNSLASGATNVLAPTGLAGNLVNNLAQMQYHAPIVGNTISDILLRGGDLYNSLFNPAQGAPGYNNGGASIVNNLPSFLGIR